jgi:hypothetical protein
LNQKIVPFYKDVLKVINVKNFIFLSLLFPFVLINASSFSMELALDYGVKGAVFPKELFVAIGAADDHMRDGLMKTCQFFNKTLSLISNPKLIHLINHPLFKTNEKTLQWLAFNAAWKDDKVLLTSAMRHMGQLGYIYQYDSFQNFRLSINLQDIVTGTMPGDCQHIAQVAESYGCKLDHFTIGSQGDALQIACFNRDAQSLGKASSVVTDFDWQVKKALFLAIDKNASDCIHLLLSLTSSNFYKNERNNPSRGAVCRAYQEFLEVAMKNDKEKSFEALIKNDVFGCRNFTYYCESLDRNMSVLDWIDFRVKRSPTDIPNGERYIATYIEQGGKYHSELDPYSIQSLFSHLKINF